jgi:hypothetical protein
MKLKVSAAKRWTKVYSELVESIDVSVRYDFLPTFSAALHQTCLDRQSS